MKKTSFILIVTLISTLFALPFNATGQKEIIFLSGPKDHGAVGRHEYERDLRVLAESLEKSTNLKGITTKVFVGKAPRDLDVYKNAAAIIINSSGDRSTRETHPLFPSGVGADGAYDQETADFLAGLDALIRKNKIGVAVFHYANQVQNKNAQGYFLSWLGGLYLNGNNPVAEWDMQLQNEKHPVLNGVKPWRNFDEIFSKFTFPDSIKGRTPLIIADPDETSTINRRLPEGYGPQVASWVYERPGGGRGFVFGGMDYHVNMENEDYRKFVLNGIVWIAGMKVPKDGVQSHKPNATLEGAATN